MLQRRIKKAELLEDYRTLQRLHAELQANPPLPEQIDSDSRVASFISYYTKTGLTLNNASGLGKMMTWIRENSSQKYRPKAHQRKRHREQNWLTRVQ